MTPVFSASPALDETVMLELLVPLILAGLALINTGFGRARSAAHAMLSSIAAIAVAAIVSCAWGFSLAGFPGLPAHVFLLGGRPWDWLGKEPLLLRGLAAGLAPSLVPSLAPSWLAAVLQIFTVGVAALIPVSAGADRWRLRACCLSTLVLAGFTYPLFAHWVWGGGWLAQLGRNYGLGNGFLDPGGAGTIQVAGGLTALSITWILGPRRGRYSPDGMAAAFPGHNIVYVLFGCLLLAPGWIGLNSAGAVLFAGAGPGKIAAIAVNTLLSASASALAAMVVTRIRFGKPDASLSANGWVGGLVASSAVCCFVAPIAAIFVGLIAGVLVTLSVELLEVRLSVDDPGGAISVHAIAGLWSLLAVGILAPFSVTAPGMLAANTRGQFLAQVVGIATLLGFVLPLTYGLNWLLDRAWPYRVEPDGERMGMDLDQLGAGAYPEFVVHSDEFGPR